MDDVTEKVRAAIEAPVAALVEIGLEGGERAALHMIAFRCILQLDQLEDVEGLMHLRKEIDDALATMQDETGGVH